MSDGKGLAGKGRLTIGRIDAIQKFCGSAIRDNPMDPEAMFKYTWAILDHYSSTVENPKHDKCPPAEKTKQIPVQIVYITIELACQEFSSIVFLLLWTCISSLESWQKPAQREQHNISLSLFC